MLQPLCNTQAWRDNNSQGFFMESTLPTGLLVSLLCFHCVCRKSQLCYRLAASRLLFELLSACFKTGNMVIRITLPGTDQVVPLLVPQNGMFPTAALSKNIPEVCRKWNLDEKDWWGGQAFTPLIELLWFCFSESQNAIFELLPRRRTPESHGWWAAGVILSTLLGSLSLLWIRVMAGKKHGLIPDRLSYTQVLSSAMREATWHSRTSATGAWSFVPIRSCVSVLPATEKTQNNFVAQEGNLLAMSSPSGRRSRHARGFFRKINTAILWEVLSSVKQRVDPWTESLVCPAQFDPGLVRRHSLSTLSL